MTRLVAACLILASWIVPALAQTNQPAPGSTPTTTINVNPTTGENKSGTAPAAGPSAPAYVFWAVYGATTVVLVIWLLAILLGLRHWSLKQALMDDSAIGGSKPSTSRLIALLGFTVIISIYLGIGYSVMYRLLSGSAVGDLSGLGTFLLGAAALFAPYLANQVKSAVVSFANAPPTPAMADPSPKNVPSVQPRS